MAHPVFDELKVYKKWCHFLGHSVCGHNATERENREKAEI